MDISPYIAGKSKTDTNKRIIKLSSNETPLGASPKALAAYVLHAAKLNRYPDSACAELREAIGKTYSIDPQHIVCGAGSDELIGLLVSAYAGEGDEVLYSQHGFLMYKIYAQSHGATPVSAPESNLTTDINALLAKVTDRTKLVFVANPNNPTGSYISASALRTLRNNLPPHVLLVVDAAYAEYVSEDDYSNGQELVAESNNVVMLRTFSKIYGLSSLRLGWAYCPPNIADVLNRVRGPFNVSAAAIAAGTEAVLDTEYTEGVRIFNDRWLEFMSTELTKLGLHVYPSVANFILVSFPLTAGKTAADANTYLLEQGIIVREVAGYGLPDCLRITIGMEEDNRAVVDALTALLAR